MSTYKERQYLSPWIKWPIVIVAGGALLFGIAFGGEQEDLLSMAVSLLGAGLAISLILLIRLDLQINEKGFSYQMFPLEWKTRHIAIEDVKSMEIRPLAIFTGYGGFGRRRKLFKKELAYILNRKAALFVELHDGRKRVFSTNEEQKLRRYIDQLNNKRDNR